MKWKYLPKYDFGTLFCGKLENPRLKSEKLSGTKVWKSIARWKLIMLFFMQEHRSLPVLARFSTLTMLHFASSCWAGDPLPQWNSRHLHLIEFQEVGFWDTALPFLKQNHNLECTNEKQIASTFKTDPNISISNVDLTINLASAGTFHLTGYIVCAKSRTLYQSSARLVFVMQFRLMGQSHSNFRFLYMKYRNWSMIKQNL